MGSGSGYARGRGLREADAGPGASRSWVAPAAWGRLRVGRGPRGGGLCETGDPSSRA